MKQTINLLPPQLRVKRILFSRLFLAEVCAFTLLFASVFGALWQHTMTLEHSVVSLQHERERLEPVRIQQEEIARLRQDISHQQRLLGSWQGKGASAYDTMTQLAGLVPPGVWLSEMRQPDKEKALSLRGFALTMEDVALFVDRLTKSPIFDKVEVKDVSRDKQQSIQFEILLRHKES